MISTGIDNLYMWFTIGRPRLLGFTEARFATSTDNGRNWSKAQGAFTTADGILMPSFLQIGKGHTARAIPSRITRCIYRTRFMTHPSDVQSLGQIDLMRVARKRPTRRGS